MRKSMLLVVCSFLVLFKAQPVSAQCPLVITPSRIVVRYGDAFSVDCNSTTSDIDGMGWESTYKGTGLIDADHVQLNIEKVDRWSIMSKCFINPTSGSQCLKDLPIIVYKLPDSVSMSLNSTQPLEENETYLFDCDVANVAPAGKVTVTWYKDGISVDERSLSNESEPAPVTRSSQYLLKAHKSDHGQTLRCEAKFDFGPQGPNLPPVRSPPTDLHVLFRPVFESTLETVEVPADGKVTLDCSAQGNPTPQHRWQVPEPLQKRAGSEAVLHLKGPLTGTYNCTASNSQGSSTKQFVVNDAPRDYTVLAAVVGVPAALGVLLLISGAFIVTKDGTFSLSKAGYSKASGPV